MALARVQTTGKVLATAASSISLTFATPPTVGNGVVAVVLSSHIANYPAGGCTDNRGNTYLLAESEPNTIANGTLAIYYGASLTATGTPFTLTVSPALGPGEFTAVAIEVSGVGGGLAVDRNQGSFGIGTAPNPNTATTTVAETFCLAAVAVAAAQTAITVAAATPAWTEEAEQLGWTPGFPGEITSRVQTTAVVPNCAWTLSASGWFSWGIVAFKATPGGTPPAVESVQPFVWMPV